MKCQFQVLGNYHLADIDENDDSVDEEVSENIFKHNAKQKNLPRNHSVPQALTACISATRFEVLGSKLNSVQPNIHPEVKGAGRDLVTLQREREVVI